MDINDDKLRGSLRAKFERREQDIPPHGWDRIMADLPQTPNRPTLAWWALIPLLLVIVGGTIWLLKSSQPTTSQSVPTAVTTTLTPNTTTENIIAPNTTIPNITSPSQPEAGPISGITYTQRPLSQTNTNTTANDERHYSPEITSGLNSATPAHAPDITQVPNPLPAQPITRTAVIVPPNSKPITKSETASETKSEILSNEEAQLTAPTKTQPEDQVKDQVKALAEAQVKAPSTARPLLNKPALKQPLAIVLPPTSKTHKSAEAQKLATAKQIGPSNTEGSSSTSDQDAKHDQAAKPKSQLKANQQQLAEINLATTASKPNKRTSSTSTLAKANQPTYKVANVATSVGGDQPANIAAKPSRKLNNANARRGAADHLAIVGSKPKANANESQNEYQVLTPTSPTIAANSTLAPIMPQVAEPSIIKDIDTNTYAKSLVATAEIKPDSTAIQPKSIKPETKVSNGRWGAYASVYHTSQSVLISPTGNQEIVSANGANTARLEQRLSADMSLMYRQRITDQFLLRFGVGAFFTQSQQQLSLTENQVMGYTTSVIGGTLTHSSHLQVNELLISQNRLFGQLQVGAQFYPFKGRSVYLHGAATGYYQVWMSQRINRNGTTLPDAEVSSSYGDAPNQPFNLGLQAGFGYMMPLGGNRQLFIEPEYRMMLRPLIFGNNLVQSKPDMLGVSFKLVW